MAALMDVSIVGKLNVHKLVIVLLLFYIAGVKGTSIRIHGAGASFPLDVYSSWISAYVAYRQNHVKLNMTYVSTGSGEGKARIKGESVNSEPVDYAGSDSLLSDSDYRNHPHLQMFPVMAGPVVIAFNVPGVKKLKLDMHHVVGIYSGTITKWNDPLIQQVNIDTRLPNKTIVVVARSDKSGTTETFTAAMTSVSQTWAQQYGKFSQGLDKEDNPERWNASVVTLFGRTNRGVTGMILSRKYSLGYLAIASATDANLPFADLVNSAGQAVVASVESVQSAMNDFTETINDRLEMPLINAPGRLSYPIAATTYFIIPMKTINDCTVARELVRYIDWYLTEEFPQSICIGFGMVPLDSKLIALIEEQVLEKITCNGQNVYRMMLLQTSQENIVSNPWTIPGAVIGVLLAVCFVLVVVGFARPYIHRQIALLRNEWLIDAKDIKPFVSGTEINSSTSGLKTKKSKSVGSGVGSANEFMPLSCGQWSGKTVVMKPSCIPSVDSISSMSFRRNLLVMRDSIKHDNLMRFYGVTTIDFSTRLVVDFCAKGCLTDFLGDCRFDLDDNFKYSMAYSVACGMSFLHSQGILHGYLKASNCYIDADWTLKIGHWEKQTLHTKVQGCWLDMQEENVWTRSAFWHAPELLIAVGIGQLTKESDVYSFSILLQEIFSRDDPYVEMKDELTPDEVVNSIKASALRPVFTHDTPESIQVIMTKAWSMDIPERPDFSQLERMIQKANPHKTSIIDSMMKNLENYVETLEKVLEEKQSEVTATIINTETILRKSMPSFVASSLLNGKDIVPKEFRSASILVVTVSGIVRVLNKVCTADAANLLNKVCYELDNVSETCEQVIKLESLADVHIYGADLSDQTINNTGLPFLCALAFNIQRAINAVLPDDGESFVLRTGIHTGPCVGTVVGKCTRKYCVIGQTVSQAWKLSYICKPSEVLVSDTTWKLLLNDSRYVGHLYPSTAAVSVHDQLVYLLLLRNLDTSFYTIVLKAH